MSESRQNENPLKIVFYMNILCDGAGMINRERAMAESLVKAGHQVSIISYFKPNSATLPEGVKVHCLIPTRFRGRLYSSAMVQPLSVLLTFISLLWLNPDWVCVDQPREARWVRYCRMVLRFKLLFTYHGVADDRFYTGKAAEALRDERCRAHQELPHADRVVVVSDFLKTETGRIGVRAHRVHNGVQREAYYPKATRSDDEQPYPLVLGINRYTEFKRIENLIDAFAIAYNNCPEARLWLFGYQDSKAYVDTLQARIRSYELEGKVVLHGPLDQSEMAEMMRRADVFANGSTDENFCMPLLEAQACGTPVIGFAAGGVKEVIQHGVTGYQAAADDIESYAFYMIQLLTNKTLRSIMSEKTQQWVKNFEYEHLAGQLVQVMNSNDEALQLETRGEWCHV